MKKILENCKKSRKIVENRECGVAKPVHLKPPASSGKRPFSFKIAFDGESKKLKFPIIILEGFNKIFYDSIIIKKLPRFKRNFKLFIFVFVKAFVKPFNKER